MTKRIIIAGGGPVGFALSLILAKYDIPSIVIEERMAPTARDESRAITWMPQALKLLDWLDVGDRFAELGVYRTVHEFRSDDTLLLRLHFDMLDTAHPYTLQLPQHDTESLLEAVARETGLVDIRRAQRVLAVRTEGDCALAKVDGSEGSYELEGLWGIGCDGARSTVRRVLGISESRKDYGMDSAVADFEMDCSLPKEVSQIVLDIRRPHGFFYFAPNRWRFVYRLNEGEAREALTTESTARELLLRYLPDAEIQRFLWASAFRLAQGQSDAYGRGRWFLAGDAAHAMGPSAGAGMMVGMLGAWRLGVLLGTQKQVQASELLERYEQVQRPSANQIQNANEMIFRNMAVTNHTIDLGRKVLLSVIGKLPFIARRMTETEALLRQPLPKELNL